MGKNNLLDTQKLKQQSRQNEAQDMFQIKEKIKTPEELSF